MLFVVILLKYCYPTETTETALYCHHCQQVAVEDGFRSRQLYSPTSGQIKAGMLKEMTTQK